MILVLNISLIVYLGTVACHVEFLFSGFDSQWVKQLYLEVSAVRSSAVSWYLTLKILLTVFTAMCY